MRRAAIHGVDLVATGTWQLSTGEATFTTGDLTAAVQAAQCPAVGLPIIKLGHIDPRFKDQEVGRVRNLKLAAEGNKITGDLTGMPFWLPQIMASAYPNRSIEARWSYQCRAGHTHPFVITGLALLGVAGPGVGVLNHVAAAAPSRSTQGTGMNDKTHRVTAAHRLIMGAARRGAISPQRALQYARMAARGEDISYLASMGTAECVASGYKRALAASPTLSAEVMSLVSQLIDQISAEGDAGEPDEFAGLYPPGYNTPDPNGPGAYPAGPGTTTVYDGDSQGQPNRKPRTVTWDGYVSASGSLPDDYTEEELHRELFGDVMYDGSFGHGTTWRGRA